MNPVSKRSVQITSMDVDLITKLALKSWEHIIELKSVSWKVNPTRIGSKDS
jgi:hypothetical protein